MTKDLAYYRTLAYEREWLPRDDESGRYFVVRLKDVPEIYGTGETRQEALAALRSAFDDQIAWCLEDGLAIPEPPLARPSQPKSIEIRVERITGVPAARVRQSGTDAPTRTGGSSESYRAAEPVDVAELEKAAA